MRPSPCLRGVTADCAAATSGRLMCAVEFEEGDDCVFAVPKCSADDGVGC